MDHEQTLGSARVPTAFCCCSSSPRIPEPPCPVPIPAWVAEHPGVPQQGCPEHPAHPWGTSLMRFLRAKEVSCGKEELRGASSAGAIGHGPEPLERAHRELGGGSLRQKVFLSFSQRQSDRAVQMNCTTFAAREAFYLLY